MLMTWVYRGIALLLLIYVTRDFWKEEAPAKKIVACMAIIPLMLRVLMIK